MINIGRPGTIRGAGQGYPTVTANSFSYGYPLTIWADGNDGGGTYGEVIVKGNITGNDFASLTINGSEHTTLFQNASPLSVIEPFASTIHINDNVELDVPSLLLQTQDGTITIHRNRDEALRLRADQQPRRQHLCQPGPGEPRQQRRHQQRNRHRRPDRHERRHRAGEQRRVHHLHHGADTFAGPVMLNNDLDDQ